MHRATIKNNKVVTAINYFDFFKELMRRTKCTGSIEPNALIRDNSYHLIRCHNELKANL